MAISESYIENIKNICVVRTDKLGDMVLTLPLCRALKKTLPGRKITLIAHSYTAPLVVNCPVIDNVIYIDKLPKGIWEVFRIGNFDAVFFPRPVFKECLSAFISGIKIRIGSAYRWYSFLFNHKVHDHRKKGIYHEAEYNVRLASSLLGRDLETRLVKPYISPESKSFAMNILSEIHLKPGKPFIIIHPGSGGSARDWRAENFGRLASDLMRISGLQVVVTGSKQEFDWCSTVCQYAKGAVNLCGMLSLEQMIALISLSSLLIANSTGVLHIAAAIGIPVVGLFPNSSHLSSRRWGPYSDNSIVVSPPASGDPAENDNMDLIKVPTVIEAALKALSFNKI